MAWRSHGDSNISLVAKLVENGCLTSQRVRKAMTAIDRGHFVRHPSDAYWDAPQPIGYAATISAPHMHAYVLDKVEPLLRPGVKVLDIGSGSGILVAYFSQLVGPNGKVVGVEHIPELVEFSLDNLRKCKFTADLVENKQVEIHAGDGRLGWAPEAPYDVIHVGAAAETVPRELVEQLAPGGRLILPVGSSFDQELVMLDKDSAMEKSDYQKKDPASCYRTKSLLPVRYVPLTDRDPQLSRHD